MTVENIKLPMKAAIYDGIFYQNVSTTTTTISPTCSTGNCTFEQYSPLFVCSRCVNVTSLIQSTCTGDNSSLSFAPCLYTLPNGLNATEGHTNQDRRIKHHGTRQRPGAFGIGFLRENLPLFRCPWDFPRDHCTCRQCPIWRP